MKISTDSRYEKLFICPTSSLPIHFYTWRCSGRIIRRKFSAGLEWSGVISRGGGGLIERNFPRGDFLLNQLSTGGEDFWEKFSMVSVRI